MCFPLEGPSITILNPDYQKTGQRPSCRFFGYTLFSHSFRRINYSSSLTGPARGKKSFILTVCFLQTSSAVCNSFQFLLLLCFENTDGFGWLGWSFQIELSFCLRYLQGDGIILAFKNDLKCFTKCLSLVCCYITLPLFHCFVVNNSFPRLLKSLDVLFVKSRASNFPGF